MGFGKFLGKVAGEISKTLKEANDERDRLKKQREDDERLAGQELHAKMQLLDKFDFHQLKGFCTDVLGKLPPEQYYKDEKTEEQKKLEQGRHDYVEFIVDSNQRIKLSHIKEYAIKRKIISPYYGEENNSDSNKKEFENIINSIKAYFQPEKITNEEHLQAQLTIFLKAKYPEKKIEREFKTSKGNELDIVVDQKFVFELKVPKRKEHLRNLSAQLEEYVEEYPNLCVVIADISKVELNANDEQVESNLTQSIKEYADKYKVKYHVQTLVFDIETRK